MRFGQWKDRIMTSPSEMYFASTPGIVLKSNGCLRFHGCPTAGGGGRLICFTRPLAAPRIRPNLDVVLKTRARIDLDDEVQNERLAMRRFPARAWTGASGGQDAGAPAWRGLDTDPCGGCDRHRIVVAADHTHEIGRKP